MPSSLQGSVPPSSRDSSAAPVSWGRAPTTPVTVPTPSTPLRASQIVQRAYNSQPRSLSRTFSVHDLNVPSPQGFSVPAPPPYGYRANEDDVGEYTDDRDDSPSQHAGLPAFDEVEIDEISPDEDERMAEAALHAPGMHTSSFKFSTDNTTIIWRKALHFPMQILAPRNPVRQHRNQVNMYSLSDSLLTQVSDHSDHPQGEQDLALHGTRSTNSQIGKSQTVSRTMLKSSQIWLYLLCRRIVTVNTRMLCVRIISTMVSRELQHQNNFMQFAIGNRSRLGLPSQNLLSPSQAAWINLPLLALRWY